MQTYFINLDSRTDRRVYMEGQLHSLGMKAERLSAVSPQTSTIRQLPTGHPEMSVRGQMTMSELACLESHSILWQRAATSDEPILVLEDDIVLSAALPPFLSSLRHNSDWDVLRLETNFHSVRLSADEIQINGVAARRLMQRQSGAGAYILTPLAARTYLSSRHMKGVPADTMIMSAPHVFELRVFQLLPALCTHLEQMPPLAAGMSAAVSEIEASRSNALGSAKSRMNSNWLSPGRRTMEKLTLLVQLLRWFSWASVIRSKRMAVPPHRSLTPK